MIRIAWLAVFVTLCTACGGGGGGDDGSEEGPTPEGPFYGSYHYLMLARNPNDDSVRSETGQVTADGLGTLVFGDCYGKHEGFQLGLFERGDLPYAVEGGRDLVITEFGGRTFEGIVAGDGLLASAAVRAMDENPATYVFVRRDRSPTQSDLTGDWHLFNWAGSASSVSDAAAGEGQVSVDAAGDFNMSGYHYNIDGALDPNPTATIDETLLVESGGWLIRRSGITGNITHRGGISEGGDLIVLGTTGGGVSVPGLTILVRADQATSTAELAGNYRVAGFESIAGRYASCGGPLSLDSQGDGDWYATYNDDGNSTNDTISVDGSVNPDGTADFTLQNLWATRGAVGPDGRYAVWSGYFTAGALPTIQFLIR